MSLHILIEGREAVIKKGSSFDFVSENPLFTESESFTFNITFPLKDCNVNTEIFGYINRHGHKCQGKPFNMQIRSASNIFNGAGVITSVNEIECTVQFLSGKSSENYYSELDDYFINNLDLGEVPEELRVASNVPVSKAWAGHEGGMSFVAIPYVNEGTGNIVNDTRAAYKWQQDETGEEYVWKEPDEAKDDPSYVMHLSWFPYLIDIAKKICDAIGFKYDFSAWQRSKWNELLVCNAVPGTWDFQLNLLMPHWSVLEFFRNLEPLIEGTFSIDVIDKKIAFVPYRDFISSELVAIDRVVDEFSSDVFDEENECSLISERYLGYAQQDGKVGRTYSCDWLIRQYESMGVNRIWEFDTPEDLAEEARIWKWGTYRGPLKYPRDQYWKADCSYVVSQDRFISNRVINARVTKTQAPSVSYEVSEVRRIPITINQFGPRNVPSRLGEKDDQDYSIEFVPAIVDDTNLRRMLFISLGDYELKSDEPLLDENESELKEAIYDSVTMRMLEEGAEDGSHAYFSNIAVGFYPGFSECFRGSNEIFPILDNFEMDLNWEPWYAKNPEYTLSLLGADGKFNAIPKINRDVKFEFSFITNKLPDVRSVFLMKGKRYLCEKLTATFTENGMSQKVKGTFWLIDHFPDRTSKMLP